MNEEVEVCLAEPTMLDFLKICYDIRAEEKEQYELLTGFEFEPDQVAAQHFAKDGVKHVILADNEPIAAGGWDYILPGVWQSWMINRPGVWKPYFRSITKLSRLTMTKLFESGARRLQTMSLASRTKAHQWYDKGLGMSYESTAKGFAINGEDAVLYVKLKEQE